MVKKKAVDLIETNRELLRRCYGDDFKRVVKTLAENRAFVRVRRCKKDFSFQALSFSSMGFEIAAGSVFVVYALYRLSAIGS
jgi:hypothetical protein